RSNSASSPHSRHARSMNSAGLARNSALWPAPGTAPLTGVGRGFWGMATSGRSDSSNEISGVEKRAGTCEAVHRSPGGGRPKLPGIGGQVMERQELVATIHLGFRFAVLCFVFVGGIVALI